MKQVVASYFPVGQCIEALRIICQTLFGATFEQVPLAPGEAWHPAVQKMCLRHPSEVFRLMSLSPELTFWGIATSTCKELQLIITVSVIDFLHGFCDILDNLFADKTCISVRGFISFCHLINSEFHRYPSLE